MFLLCNAIATFAHRDSAAYFIAIELSLTSNFYLRMPSILAFVVAMAQPPRLLRLMVTLEMPGL
jgi:hypothetical protein